MARKREGTKRTRKRKLANERRGHRDYRAEYLRRIARGLAKGLSRSQARGHPKASERLRALGRRLKLEDRRLQLALKALKQGHGLSESARSAGISPEKFRRFISTTGAARRRGRRWIVRDDLPEGCRSTPTAKRSR